MLERPLKYAPNEQIFEEDEATRDGPISPVQMLKQAVNDKAMIDVHI